MNLLCDQSDGAASHSARSPKNGNQVSGYAALRARSLFACLYGISRSKFRRALHINLFVTVPARVSVLVLTFLLSSWNAAWAADSFMPKLDIGKGGKCVEETQWMRKNHMHVLLHQRDETVHQGIRDGKYSLKDCIECHASTKDDSVIGRADSFCEGCHRYEAVKIDCFECHSSKRQSSLTKVPSLAQKESK